MPVTNDGLTGVAAVLDLLQRRYDPDDPLYRHLPGKHDQADHGRRRGLRPSLAKAKTTAEIAAVVSGEASRLIGDHIAVDFSGADVEVARQFGEGILQGVERFPATPLREVGTYGPGGSDTHNARTANASKSESEGATAFALTGGERTAEGGQYEVPRAKLPNGTHTTGTAIYLNLRHATPAHWKNREGFHTLVASGRLSGGQPHVGISPKGVALHEFGHSIAHHGRPEQPEFEVGRANRTKAAAAGMDAKTHASRISRYAGTNDAELTAEMFADVMLNGKKAHALSKELFEVFELNVKGWEQEVMP